MNRIPGSLLSLTLSAMLLAGCVIKPEQRPSASLRVLSSPPELVSGGNARIEVTVAPAIQPRITFWLNGRQVMPAMTAQDERLEGVVDGLDRGRNLLQVRHGDQVIDAITLTNHPLTGPMFSGPQQQPFICRTDEAGLGSPMADNQAGIGHPVYDASGQLTGYSRYCAVAPRIFYFYFAGAGFKPFDPATGYDAPPPDLVRIPVNGVAQPFVVRVEAGSINRFLYTIAMLAPTPVFDQAAWNRKLVYWLRGGAGIGHQQGEPLWLNDELSGSERFLFPRMLAQGYGLISSTGNESAVHLNMRLAEETALMTKEHFIEAYGNPVHTIGVGGSGGAAQQYLFAQNRPGLLDGGVAIQSFPDLVTQITPVSDCPLLGKYFQDEVARNPASPWAVWSNQRLIEGMNASDTVRNAIFGKPGSTECINGWRLTMPTLGNPFYRDPEYDEVAADYRYPPQVLDDVKWTHWNDLENIYGTDRQGFAPDTVDNVGVQYGLRALVQGNIDVGEFLRINACVGGWKALRDFVPWDQASEPFDARNMQRSASCREPAGRPAPRRSGSVWAMQRAYASGQVFTGRKLAMPLIDLRPYLEPQLDMHDSRQSFAARARMLRAPGDAEQRQVIWMTGSVGSALAAGIDALAQVDRYLGDQARPAGFVDKCVDANGTLIASGKRVWDGILNSRPPGLCTSVYPPLSSPRMVAGESIRGELFKCELRPVSEALEDGTYGTVRFSGTQRRWLRRIFPQGVCGYPTR